MNSSIIYSNVLNFVLFRPKWTKYFVLVCKSEWYTPCSTLDIILAYFGVFRVFWVISLNSGQNSRFSRYKTQRTLPKQKCTAKLELTKLERERERGVRELTPLLELKLLLEASPILVSSKIGGRDEMREGLVIGLLNRREER